MVVRKANGVNWFDGVLWNVEIACGLREALARICRSFGVNVLSGEFDAGTEEGD